MEWDGESNAYGEDAAEEDRKFESDEFGRDAHRPQSQEEDGERDQERKDVHSRNPFSRDGGNVPVVSLLGQRTEPCGRNGRVGGLVIGRVEDAGQHVAVQAPQLIA